MAESSIAVTGASAADSDNGIAQHNNKPSKRPVAVVPPCPAAVSTGYLILRGILQHLLGPTVICGPFQATYIKDGDLTGKFAVTVKKVPDNVHLSNDGDTVWNTLEAAAHAVIQQQNIITISTFEGTKEELMATYNGATMLLDETHVGKKSKISNDATLTVCYAPPLGCAVLPSMPYASVSLLHSGVQLVRSECQIKQGAKATSITIKFRCGGVGLGQNDDSDDSVIPRAAATHATAPPTPSELEHMWEAWSLPVLHALQTTASNIPASSRSEPILADPVAAKMDGAAAVAAAADNDDDDDMVVTVETVTGKIDYTRLVQQFGSTLIDDTLLQTLHDLTVGRGHVPSLHRFLRRGMFFSHRDLDVLLRHVQADHVPMYLYTGRGPSSESMHLGHLIPFLFTQWLQQALQVPLVIQMTDDEKFIFKGDYDPDTGDNLLDYQRLTYENAKDIIACGFDKTRTFLFSDLSYVGVMYPNICRIWKAVTSNAVSSIFGFDGTSNIGKMAFPAIQAAPSFASSFPTVLEAPSRESPLCCLIPCAIDQDPYFRLTRDVAHKLVSRSHVLSGKPALIHSKFFPPLQGATGKMSSSDQNSAIFLTDTADDIARKIKTHAFSGGGATQAEQIAQGADLDIDVAYQWLRFFLEDDDELARIGRDYGSGSGEYWSTGAVKTRLIAVLQELVAAHQARRAQITDDEVREWMQERSIMSHPT